MDAPRFMRMRFGEKMNEPDACLKIIRRLKNDNTVKNIIVGLQCTKAMKNETKAKSKTTVLF